MTEFSRIPGTESGAFPETLREALQRIVDWGDDKVTAAEYHHKYGRDNNLNELLAIARAALERPRPAPPEPSATFTARQTLKAQSCNYCGESAKVFFSLNPEATPDICPACFVTALGFAEPDAETFTLLPKRSPGGSAGTGAAPPDSELLLLEMNLARLTDELNRIPELRREDELQLAKASLDMVRGWRGSHVAVRGGAAQPPPSAPDEIRCPHGRPLKPEGCRECLHDALDMAAANRGVPREETNHE